MKKWIFAALALALVTGLIIGLYMYNKPLESMTGQQAELTVSAADLYQSFDTNETAANGKYLGKVIEVSGTIESISTGDDGATNILLNAGDAMGGVICRLDATVKETFQEGSQIALRGECTGKLMDVELARCVPVQ
ncbi:MAG: hypothetical protein IPJ06_15490 [Saprospiraceae bacterium]|nr:hypothetical protein [Saprospiraceae bacterium]